MSKGKVAAALSHRRHPAWIPPMSGSTRRSTTGRPSRSPTMSQPTGRRRCRWWPGAGRPGLWPRQRLGRAQDPRTGERPPAGGHAEVQPFGHGGQPVTAHHEAPVAPPAPARRTARALRRARWLRDAGTGKRRRPGPRCVRRTRPRPACLPLIARLEHMHHRGVGTVPHRSGNQFPAAASPAMPAPTTATVAGRCRVTPGGSGR